MTLKHCTRRYSMGLGTFTLVAMLAACGGGDSGTPDPLQSYRQQTLQWAACDPTITGEPEEESQGLRDHLGDRLQCSTMRAPLDWSQPDRSDVFVSVMRVAAADPAQRRGALVFNPGGPGTDGLGQALGLFQAFGRSNPQSTQGALQLRLIAHYDLVGFSPRGTGASTRLSCATNELERPAAPSAVGVSDEGLANGAYNDRKIAEACLRNPIAPYVNTDATARDVDLLRGLLGDDKLNYVGYSYGTWLGGWYASLFPDKVGRMVLDSSINYPQPMEQTFIAQPEARQRLHDTVMLPYAARHNAYFQLGSSAADIAAMVQSLSPHIRYALGGSLSSLTYHPGGADTYVATLGAAQWLESALAALPDPADTWAMETALRQHAFVASDPARDAVVRAQAKAIYGLYHSSFLSPRPSIDLGASAATYWTVRCNDDVATTDAQAWSAFVRSTALRAPLYAKLDNPCAYWGGPRVTKPNVAAMQGLDVLMVQSQYDAATSTEGANDFFAQLPSARRIYVPDEFQHGVFPYLDTCVDATVIHYLLGETPTERETLCTAKPLQQDAPALEPPALPEPAPEAAPAAQRRAVPGPEKSRSASPPASAPHPGADAEPPTYLDPEKAQQLIERFKEGIGRRH